MNSTITRPSHGECTLISLALVCSLVVSCVEHTDNDAPLIEAITPAEMSMHVPTAHIRVDEVDFQYMSDHPLTDIEIPASLTVWRAGEPVCSGEGVELQIKGASSAALPAKALGVKFDRSLRSSTNALIQVPHQRSEHSLTKIKAFRLRNGGNTFYTSLLKDLAYARMVAASDLDVLSLYGEPAATFVNGNFYSLHNLRTENNANGISRLLGIDEESLSLAAVEDVQSELEIKRGAEEGWRRLERLVAAGDVQGTLAELNVSSFIDFIIGGACFATQDWPHRNVRLYRIGNGPVEFILYDFDFAGQAYSKRTPYEFIERGQEGLIRSMFLLCYQDSDFQQQLEQRYDEVMLSGQLSDEQLRHHLTELATTYAPVIRHQTQAFGFPTSTAAWYVDLEATAGDYAQRYQHLPDDFK